MLFVARGAESTIFTARRYATAVFAVVVCWTVCLPTRHKPVLYRNDWTNRAGFWRGGFLPSSTYPTLLKDEESARDVAKIFTDFNFFTDSKKSVILIFNY